MVNGGRQAGDGSGKIASRQSKQPTDHYNVLGNGQRRPGLHFRGGLAEKIKANSSPHRQVAIDAQATRHKRRAESGKLHRAGDLHRDNGWRSIVVGYSDDKELAWVRAGEGQQQHDGKRPQGPGAPARPANTCKTDGESK